jgi:Helix-turn-helix domain
MNGHETPAQNANESSDPPYWGELRLSDYAARVIVASMDALAAKIDKDGGRLYPHVVAVRNLVAESLTRAGTHGDMGTEVAASAQVLALGAADAFVDTNGAAEALGISPDGVRWLRRKGHLDATRVGNRWLFTWASVEDYRARRGEKRRERSA